MRAHRLVLLTLLSALLGAASGLAVAHAEVIERVVAVVNDDAIFLSELRQKAAPVVRRAMQAPTESQRMAAVQQIYQQLLDTMIDERLILQAAEQEDVSVTTAEVNEAVGNVRTQSGLSEADFWEAVRGQGFSESAYRSDVRRQLLRLKMLNQRVRGRVNITEDDVRRRYEESAVRARRESTFEACYVRYALPASAGPTAVRDATRQAERARDSLRSAEDFEDAGGSCTGRISEGDLAPELGEALAVLEEGQVSPAVLTDGAVFLLLLRNRQMASEALPAYESIRMDLYREMVQEAMARQEALYLDELRRRAVVVRRLEN